MKAAVLVRQDAALEIYELEMPKLDVGQVLVKVEHSGICGKQIDEITGRQGEDRYLPHLLGHEGGGQVVEIGPGVTKVKPGDRVVMHWVKGSGIDSPTTWHYTDTPDKVEGRIACGTYNNGPDLVWSKNSDLLLADARSPNMDDLHKWWLEYG